MGRPPDTDSAETRARIIDAARDCFAELGYEASTNKDLALRAGYTTGAMYHYFGSKQALYTAVFNQVQLYVYETFEAASQSADTFAGKIDAILDAAVQLNRLDPTLAQFLVTARIDMVRHPELGAGLAEPAARRDRFFTDVIDTGVRTGEVDPGDQEMLLDVISAILTGLVSYSSSDTDRHLRTVTGVKRLLDGKLLRPSR